MIAHLRGKLLVKHPNQAIVETAGVGYDVTISVSTFSDLPDTGSEVALCTEVYETLTRDGVAARVVRHNEPMARFYHAPLYNLISRFVPERTKPSYCFAAHYQAGARLERHTDRPQCVWNISVAVDSAPESTCETAWPLFIESRGTPYPVRLGPGDGVLYSGTRNPHWREAQPDRQVSTLMFYHFVPSDFSGDLD